MLILTRTKEQSIQIGDDVSIKVLDIYSDNRVRVGITAPKDVLILRSEHVNETPEEHRAELK